MPKADLVTKGGFKPDHKSFGQFLLSEQARRPVVQVAHDVARTIQATAPRSKGPGPHMADQFKVNEKSPPRKVARARRVGAEVYNENPAAAANEFAFGDMPEANMWFIRRAGAQYGDYRTHGRL